MHNPEHGDWGDERIHERFCVSLISQHFHAGVVISCHAPPSSVPAEKQGGHLVFVSTVNCKMSPKYIYILLPLLFLGLQLL